MAIRSGFGTLRQLFTTGAGNDRNIIIQLPCGSQDLQVRIRAIIFSYAVDVSAAAAAFAQGRIIVVSGLFSDITLALAPDAISATAESLMGSSFSTKFDHVPFEKFGQINFGEQGLLLPKGTDATVILCAPKTTGDVQPAFTNMQGSMTVVGQTEGLGNVFGKLR